jgi:hypothetical protein
VIARKTSETTGREKERQTAFFRRDEKGVCPFFPVDQRARMTPPAPADTTPKGKVK